MQTFAKFRYAHISPQKCRLVADQIRGQTVASALKILAFSRKKAARMMHKVLESAIANAEHNHGADIDELKVSNVQVDTAPFFARYAARAKGLGPVVQWMAVYGALWSQRFTALEGVEV